MTKTTDIMEMVRDICKRNGATITKVEKHGDCNMVDFTTKGGKQWCLDIRDTFFNKSFVKTIEWKLYTDNHTSTASQLYTLQKSWKLFVDALKDNNQVGRTCLMAEGKVEDSYVMYNPFLLQTKEICDMYNH